jgi:hypothetical protein
MASSQKVSEMQRHPNQTPLSQSPRGPPFAPQRQQSLQATAPFSASQIPTSPSTSGPSSYSPSPLANQGPTYAAQARPAFPHTNTQVQVVDHAVPQPQPPHSPSYILQPDPNAEDGITLADIPQFIEATQNRSLPNTHGRPHIAELPPHELLLVKYAALLVIAKSPLGDPALVEEMIEFLEAKKGGFWNKLFNKGDKKNMKKKGIPPFYINPVIRCSHDL